jgi:copper homeostasis protein
MPIIEICANSVTSALAAQAGGAQRVELCTNLAEGGTTPSYGEIAMATKLLNIPVYVLIRARPGNFVYSDVEYATMIEDVRQVITLGCRGIVMGILRADGSVDVLRCRQLIGMASAAGLGVTFHRAFDVVADQLQALEDIIGLGTERILTSGGKKTAMEGASQIAAVIKAAAGRITIMPGSGVNGDNIMELKRLTGADEFHASCKVVAGGDERVLGFGDVMVTDEGLVRGMVRTMVKI